MPIGKLLWFHSEINLLFVARCLSCHYDEIAWLLFIVYFRRDKPTGSLISNSSILRIAHYSLAF